MAMIRDKMNALGVMKMEKNPIDKVPYDPEKTVVVGPEYNFWLNEEDDIYDELYRQQNTDQEQRPKTRWY